MAKGKSAGIRWVGDASLIAENKSATASWQSDTDSGNPNPMSGEPAGVGLGKVSAPSGSIMSSVKPARKHKAKAKALKAKAKAFNKVPPLRAPERVTPAKKKTK